MPLCSSRSCSSRSASVLVLPITKSGSAASSSSTLGSVVVPRFFTVSGKSRSNWVQLSFAVATRVSCPPARHQTSAKLPIKAATRLGFASVTSRPKSSVKVMDSAGVSVSAGDGSLPPQAESIVKSTPHSSRQAIRFIWLFLQVNSYCA